jgi:programmed cell death protein 5
MGRVNAKITDEQLKQLLKNLAGQKREINITRR